MESVRRLAKALSKQGHKVIIHGRNLKKAEGVVQKIRAESPDADLDILTADLMSFRCAIANCTRQWPKM